MNCAGIAGVSHYTGLDSEHLQRAEQVFSDPTIQLDLLSFSPGET